MISLNIEIKVNVLLVDVSFILMKAEINYFNIFYFYFGINVILYSLSDPTEAA